MKKILCLILISGLLLFTQSVQAFDYIGTPSQKFPFSMNLTILETIGTMIDKDNNTISNFSHYLIGFEIYLENYSIEIENAYDENGHRRAYVLDGYDRITNVLEYNNDPVLNWNFESDIYNTSYEYDTADNLIKITDALGNQFTFTYDSLGRRIALSDPDLGNWSYEYDLVGNLITQKQNGGGNLVTGDGYYREYDGLNQLIRIRNGSSSSSPEIENYTYDPFGQRIKITRNDTANTTIYTPFKELMQIRNSTGSYDFTYVYQDGVLVARVNPDGSKYFYHPDHLGSTSLITDANGNVVENTYYSPYGEILGGGTADIRLYTNQIKDSVLCQYYYVSRYYNPCKGMFDQHDDPESTFFNPYDPQSLNKYSYAQNNPYRYTDPSGRFIQLPIIGAIVIRTAPLWLPPLVNIFIGKPLPPPQQPASTMVGQEQVTTPQPQTSVPTNVPTKPSDVNKPPSAEDLGKTAEKSVQGITQTSQRTINIDSKQLQEKFKHAKDFGIYEPYNPSTAAKYDQALKFFVQSEKTLAIKGTYRGIQQGTHYYNPTTKQWMFVDDKGNYVTGFRLGAKQIRDLLTNRNVG